MPANEHDFLVAIENAKLNMDLISADMVKWREQNSQSNPDAVFEYRSLRKSLQEHRVLHTTLIQMLQEYRDSSKESKAAPDTNSS